MARLETQDKLLTTGMGGVLPELPDPTILRRVLDVGCGTGGWLMETAKTYPTIEKLVGGDISGKMMDYACARAKAQHLDRRVQFQTMDALRVLEFPAESFDLVNQRAGVSWLRTWEWTKLLLEYQRVCRPGGIIRITEGNIIIETNSPALTKLSTIGLETFYHSGRLFTPNTDGLTGEIVRLMRQHGLQDIQTRVHPLIYRPGTVEWQYFYEDTVHFFHLLLPFFHKWTRVPPNYEEIYQQALKEMQQPDFVATWTWITIWGTKPKDGKPMLMRGLR
jgi:ubiquinone/menaquinone biosynthesis C-methylase UbiE